MAASAFAAYGVYPSNAGLKDVLGAFSHQGVDKESICMMLPACHPIARTVREASSASGQTAAQDEATGLIGWLSELGAVLIPTFGFFIRSKAFFRTLIEEQDSTESCGTLVALGFPEHTALQYGSRLKDSGVLVYLSCPEAISTARALELLRGTGAQETGLLKQEKSAALAASCC